MFFLCEYHISYFWSPAHKLLRSQGNKWWYKRRDGGWGSLLHEPNARTTGRERDENIVYFNKKYMKFNCGPFSELNLIILHTYIDIYMQFVLLICVRKSTMYGFILCLINVKYTMKNVQCSISERSLPGVLWNFLPFKSEKDGKSIF